MPQYATGKHALAISDRSGLQFPWREMVTEWNGAFVHFSEYEPVGKEPTDDFSDVNVVVHFAEKNKGNDEEVFYSNRRSCHNLIDSIKHKDITLIYASSTHQDDDNLYGLYRRNNIKRQNVCSKKMFRKCNSKWFDLWKKSICEFSERFQYSNNQY